MRKFKVVFVVLNYMNYDDTAECVDSICENIDTDRFHIVIVDNNSPDGSGRQLKKRFTGNKYVTVLLNDENEGVSKGWNNGICYAKENFTFDFLAVPNNDTLFIEKEFCKKLDEEYKKSEFAVLGPMVLTPEGRCDDNPIFDTPYTREKALYDIKQHEKKIKQLKSGTYSLCRRWRGIVRKFNRKAYANPYIRNNRKEGFFLYRQENVVLHGCFFVLSKRFFEKFEMLDVRSFMYAEEDILYMHVIHEGLKTVYLPDIKIYHKGDRSTSKATTNHKAKEIFRSQESIKAIKGYLGLLDELGE